MNLLPWLLIALMLAIPLIFMLVASRRKPLCPECGTRMPTVMAPWKRTMRMIAVGGYLCPQCGCETDMNCVPVDPDAPLPRGTGRKWVLLLAFAGCTQVLMMFVMFYGPAMIAGRPPAPPPLIVVPAPVPPVPPG